MWALLFTPVGHRLFVGSGTIGLVCSHAIDTRRLRCAVALRRRVRSSRLSRTTFVIGCDACSMTVRSCDQDVPLYLL